MSEEATCQNPSCVAARKAYETQTHNLSIMNREWNWMLTTLQWIAAYPSTDKYFDSTGALNMKIKAREVLEQLAHEASDG